SRPAVICFEDAFHGRTLLTMSLTSKTRPYKAGFQPFASDIYRIPYAYPYRHAAGTSAEDFAHHLEDAFKRSVAPESVAAVLAEPVLGEGGFVVPPPGYFKLLQKIAASTASFSSPTKYSQASDAPESGSLPNI